MAEKLNHPVRAPIVSATARPQARPHPPPEPPPPVRPGSATIASPPDTHAAESASLQDFLGDLLLEQQRLQTPVARFAALHDHGQGRPSALQSFRPSLIPLTAPGPGEQYAFEVDLDSCSGCKACVAGCHALNGLDDEETWRDTGLLLGGDERHPFQQTVTTACHHCADPACLNGCPVLAYEKDPLTGIVRHLDDQCIGCSYCVLKCPYDVPKYSARLGIVRKCDMCHQRLAAGEAPACAQACPTHAIKIVKVEMTVASFPPAAARGTPHAEIRDPQSAVLPQTSRPSAVQPFLPGAPDPAYTRPTTRYVSKRTLPADLRPADQNTLRPQPAHWPLVLMLVCTQVALGIQAAFFWTARGVAPPHPAAAAWSVTSLVTLTPASLGWAAVALAALGLAASVAHLGQPLRAWRVFLGLRRSWLSREAVLFGAWFPALGLSVATNFLDPWSDLAALALGLAGVFCSAMIYLDTRRHAWRAGQSLPRFFGTVVLFTALAVAGVHPGGPALLSVVAALLLKLAVEARAARPASTHDADTPLFPGLATARLLTGPFRRIHSLRFLTAFLALLVLPAALPGPDVPGGGVTHYVTLGLAGGLLFAGEILERYLYFRTVDAPKMPGYAARGAVP